jgi:hypothetical protein
VCRVPGAGHLGLATTHAALGAKKLIMTYYSDLGFSGFQMAGAVAEAALHDPHLNNFGFPGFPQIEASGEPSGSFTIVLRWNKTSLLQFQLSQAEAKAAVEKFRSQTGYDPAIFNKVQRAVAELEGKASRYPTS